MPGIVINEDGRNDKIHIKATERQHEEVARLISQLDGTANAVAVISLTRMDPVAAGALLRSMFSTDGDSAPVIEADTLYGRRIVIRGSSEQITQAKLMLAEMGEDGSGTPAQDVNRGPLRRYPLGGRDSENFVRILEQIWGQNSKVPVRVDIPSSNPIRDRVVPSLRGNTRFPYGEGQLPSTQRRSPSDELERKSTATPRHSLFPVSAEDEQPATESAKADASGEAVNSSDLPAQIILRVTKEGNWFLNGKPVSATQLSIEAGKWLDATPKEERQFLVSTHPDAPSAKSLPALTILSNVGINAAFKVSEAGDPEPNSVQKQDATETQQPSKTPPAEIQPPVTSGVGNLPIQVSVRGGELVLFDPTGKNENLDEMEALIEQLALAIPPQTTWTVYYLRSAEATEIATMLEQLFPSSSVGSGNVGDDG
ncbi:MAG: hypothetical protein KDA84_14155, partial [Planctomycetaceae bacterium]|nr:hypothetical protein [Planctomycetaceae bacterium]